MGVGEVEPAAAEDDWGQGMMYMGRATWVQVQDAGVVPICVLFCEVGREAGREARVSEAEWVTCNHQRSQGTHPTGGSADSAPCYILPLSANACFCVLCAAAAWYMCHMLIKDNRKISSAPMTKPSSHRYQHAC